VDWSEGWAFAHFGMSDRSFFWAKNEQFGKSLIFCSFLLFRSFWMSKKAIALFVALLKRAKKEQSLICSFEKSEKNNRSSALLHWATKWGIALSLFFNERMSNRLLNYSFENSGNEWWENERMSNCPTLGQSLIRSLLTSTHCKRAIEQFVAHSLIVKERLSNLLLICSL